MTMAYFSNAQNIGGFPRLTSAGATSPALFMLLQPCHNGRKYYNVLPTSVSPPSGYGALLRRYLFEKGEREPQQPLGPFRADAAALAAPVPADALRATWLGHSTMLLEVDGRRFLTDPVWAERVSPSQLVGPKRFFAPPLPWPTCRRSMRIILSHDHYDHLDPAGHLGAGGARRSASTARWAWARICALGRARRQNHRS